LQLKKNVHFGCRYSLAVHQTADELRAFGMTDKMIADQEWYLCFFFQFLKFHQSGNFFAKIKIIKLKKITLNFFLNDPNFFSK
jgi:hypothetical protein